MGLQYKSSSSDLLPVVLAAIPDQLPENSPSPIPFFHLIERLKREKREGWRRFGITGGESIADHMYRMSIMTMIAPASLSSRLNIAHCTKMALVHDMAEALVGDLTPVDGVPKEEKSRREAETMDYICISLLGKVNGGENGASIRKIWQEYEDSETDESHFVHDIDKVELILQMVEYERTHDTLDLSEFSWVEKKIVLPEMKDWAREILEERTRLWESKGVTPKGPEQIETIQAQQDQYYGKSNGPSV
jgi:putative hydrolases of HD superfamily